MKERLAAQFGNDRDGYTEAKSAFIAEALAAQ
ncbi:GrpB family protein [Bradyrhizobium sp. NAS80.1]|nr:GrpB family protein [Bradyrhizobium sp. NAS80.1]